jgi:hypothetical protein
MSIADNVEADLNQYRVSFDLIYFDLDGHWKRVHAATNYGKPFTAVKEVEEFLELYRRGREDWNLKIACITEHVFVDVM